MSTTSLKDSIDRLSPSEDLPLIRSETESSQWMDTASNVVSFIANGFISFAQCFVSAYEFLCELWIGRDAGIGAVVPADVSFIDPLNDRSPRSRDSQNELMMQVIDEFELQQAYEELTAITRDLEDAYYDLSPPCLVRLNQDVGLNHIGDQTIKDLQDHFGTRHPIIPTAIELKNAIATKRRVHNLLKAVEIETCTYSSFKPAIERINRSELPKELQEQVSVFKVMNEREFSDARLQRTFNTFADKVRKALNGIDSTIATLIDKIESQK